MTPSTGWRRRRRYLVDRDFQLRFFLTRWLLAVAISSLVVAVSTLYLYVFVYAANRVQTQWSEHLAYFVPVPLFLLVVLLVRWAIRISHHVSGSMQRVREEMRRAEAGDLSVRVRLRRKDQLDAVARMLNQLLAGLEAKVAQDRRRARRLETVVEGISRLAEDLPTESPQRDGIRERLEMLRLELPRMTEGFTLAADAQDRLGDTPDGSVSGSVGGP
ncbi:methyl-accepting chemotaxis protein [bacterium]|nr:methyl-accepting chemotaxis protein [bacterium]